jgi:hypothetical protein
MSFFEELTKKATGLLADVRQTTGGSAGDIAGEAAMPDDYGKPIAPVTSFPSYKRTQSPLINNPIFPTNIIPPGEGKIGNTKILPDSMMDKKLPSSRDEAKTNALGITNDQSKKFFGMDLNQIKASWKDKGGFEGLMSNPGFTLGLAIMSSSAQGRPISESLLNNVLASGEISSAYADRIKARSKVLAPVTDEQRDEIAAVLAEDNYYEPDFLDKMKTGNQSAKYRESLDLIYDRAQNIAKSEAKGGKEVRFGRKHIRQAIKDLEGSGKLKKRDPSFFGIRAGTLEATGGIDGARAEGGPVEANKNYLVGEKGPEVFVPQVDGNIINNDDAKVVNMLLEHNPQLKNISRARAVKILKNRFPDYF